MELDVPLRDVAGIVNHLKQISELPQGRLGSILLSRSVELSGLTLGGTGLTESKLQYFRNYVQDPNRARWLGAYLKSLESRIPALYVGKATNLVTRVAQHLRGDTDFGVAVMADEKLDWSLLNLEYVNLGKAQQVKPETLLALEQLFTVLSIASFTRRAG